MTNVYGYNRKTREEDDAILAAVRRHHEEVENKGFLVVMTSLVGSQNYDLDDSSSDIDTFSLIYPTLSELDLLKKTSPNSVEYFASKYKVYNPIFEQLLKEYLEDNSKLWAMLHCNYEHMLYAMAGMAHQLTKRNMPAGKRFGHALRLDDMLYHFMNSLNASAVLEMRMGGNRDLAIMAKRDQDPTHEVDYNTQCEQIANKLDTFKDSFTINEEQKAIEKLGLTLINEFQNKLFYKYLMETIK